MERLYKGAWYYNLKICFLTQIGGSYENTNYIFTF